MVVQPDDAQVPNPQSAQSSDPGSMPPQVSLGMALLAEGLQRGLAWARRSIVEPHAEHLDVADHPDCVLCVAMVALQGATAGSSAGSAESGQPFGAAGSAPVPQVPIEWVPVRRRGAGSAD